MRDRDCVEFLQWALPRLHMRWSGFRKVRRQVCRRIVRRMAEEKIADFEAYRDRLQDDESEWEALDALCRVTISRFFRDRGVFEALAERVFPELATLASRQGRTSLAAWSVGCASGEEPYSLSILWRCALAPSWPGLKLEITASDSDPRLLQRARRAVYPPGSIREVPPEERRIAFKQHNGQFELRPELARGIDFRCEDLRRTQPPGPFDLVLCRNLAFTYYAEDLQVEVLQRIAAVLLPEGVLVVGRHEAPPDNQGFEPIVGAPSCYRRR